MTQCLQELDVENDEYSKVRLRSLCGLFMSIHRNKVYFLYQTAREFLLAHHPLSTETPINRQWQFSITMQFAHRVLVEACVRYLDFFNADLHLNASLISPPIGPAERERDDRFAILRRYTKFTVIAPSFLDYACRYWPFHFREADPRSGDDVILLGCKLCDPKCKVYSLWYARDNINQRGFSSSLQVASYFGLNAVVSRELELGAVLEATDHTCRHTALGWAARTANAVIVKMLVEKGANLEARDGQQDQTPLSWASDHGSEAVVRILIDSGADLEAKDRYGRTPLSWAKVNRHEKIFNLLIEKGADPQTATYRGNLKRTFGQRRIKGFYAGYKIGDSHKVQLRAIDYGRDPWANRGTIRM